MSSCWQSFYLDAEHFLVSICVFFQSFYLDIGHLLCIHSRFSLTMFQMIKCHYEVLLLFSLCDILHNNLFIYYFLENSWNQSKWDSIANCNGQGPKVQRSDPKIGISSTGSSYHWVQMRVKVCVHCYSLPLVKSWKLGVRPYIKSLES